MRFGASAISWPISPVDFVVGTGLGPGMCIGGFIALSTAGTSAPSFIVGDTFLKNVYSVYRAQPPSVGFAVLSDAAAAMNVPFGPVPTPTIGEVAATVAANADASATDRSSAGTAQDNAARGALAGIGGSLVAVPLLAGAALLW